MNNVLIPTNDKFVEEVAKAMSRDRLYRDAADMLNTSLGINMEDHKILDDRFNKEFEILWSADDEESMWAKENCMLDAIAAINKINLLLLTMPG